MITSRVPHKEMNVDPTRNRRAPALGERAALIGFYAQNRAAAAILLMSLLSGRLEWARFGDLEAGRVDDLQIAAPKRLDAYQFKWSDFPGSMPFSTLLRAQSDKPALLRALAEGWRERSTSFPDRDVHIHLVTNNYPSTQDSVSPIGAVTGQRHFAAFLANGWEPLAETGIEWEATAAWQEAWKQVSEVTNLSGAALVDFVRHCRIECRADFRSPNASESDEWEETVRQFIERLFALPANPRKFVELSRTELIHLFGISDDRSTRHRHEFRLADHVREPLEATRAKLDKALKEIPGGYVCLLGTPGSGKSTLLTQVLRARPERVVRYYAYTPDGPNTARGEAVNFFADVVEELEELGIPSEAAAPHRADRILLRDRFYRQLAKLGDAWVRRGERTLLLIDGLDHIEREQRPARSLLDDLPSPIEIPEGVLIVLGTQTLGVLRADIQAAIDSTRQIATEPLSALAMRRTLRACGLEERLDETERAAVLQLSEGHPLAFSYLIRELLACEGPAEVSRTLAETRPYRGDIDLLYRTHWNTLGNEDLQVRRLLGQLARLRRPTELDWVAEWADEAALDTIERRFGHYFREVDGAWQFFHNSFRLFIIAETGVAGGGRRSREKDIQHTIAEICARSPKDSPWRWEEMYHRFQAEEFQTVLELAAPEWFRSQYFAWRPRHLIFDDIRLANSALAFHNSGLSAARLALIKSELGRRFDALQLENNFLILLLRSGRKRQVLESVRSGAELHVGEETALEICDALRELGDTNEAASLLDLVDPLVARPHGFGLDDVGEHREFLIRWSLSAIPLLSTEEVLRVLKQFDYTKIRERHPVRTDAGSAINQEQEHERTLSSLAVALIDVGDEENAEIVAAQVPWETARPKSYFDWLLAQALHSTKAGRSEAAVELLASAEERFPRLIAEEEASLKIAELWHDAGDLQRARDCFRRVKAPSPWELGEMDLGMSRVRVDPWHWLRMHYLLDERDLTQTLRFSESPEDEGVKLLARSRAAAASIWADLRKRSIPDEVALLTRIESILRPLLQRFPQVLRWRGGVMDGPRLRDAASTVLIAACAVDGQRSLRVLGNAFGASWTSEAARHYWLGYGKRESIKEMLKNGAEPEWAVAHLLETEAEIETADNTDSRVSAAVAQAEAWLLAGEPERALNQVTRAQRFAFGLGYRKDHQLTMWIRLLGRGWRIGASDPEEDCRNLSRSIVALEYEVDGRALSEAADALIDEAYRTAPSLGVGVWEYLHEQGAIHFGNSLAALLQGALASGDFTGLEVAALILAELLVATNLQAPEDLIEKVIRLIGASRGSAGALEFATGLAARVKTLCPNSLRAGWWRPLRLVTHEIGHEIPAPPFSRQRDYDYEGATREARVTLAMSPEPLSAMEVMLREEANVRDSSTRSGRHIHWAEVVGSIAPRLKREELLKVLELFGGSKDSRILAALAPHLVRAGAASECGRIADDAISALESGVRSGYVGPRQWVDAMVPLLEAKPDAGTKRLFSSFATDNWLTPEEFERIDLWLFTDDGERKQYHQEVAAHVRMLLEGCDTPAPEMAPFGHSRGSSEALCGLVCTWLRHSSNVVRHAAYRISTALTQSGHREWLVVLSRLIAHRSAGLPDVLTILDGVSKTAPDTLGDLREELTALCRESDLDACWHSKRIAARCGWTDPLNMPFKRERNTDFDLHLPVATFDDIPAFLGSRSLPLQMVADRSQVPLANLIRRCEVLRGELLQSDPTLARDRKTTNDWLGDLGLRSVFRSSNQLLAEQSCFRLLSELHAAGKIPDESLPHLWRLFSARDSDFAGRAPSERPSTFALHRTSEDDRAWSQEWLRTRVPVPRRPFLVRGDWQILAYHHTFRIQTDHLPEEVHTGLVLPSIWPAPELWEPQNPPFEPVPILAIEDYYAWHEPPREPSLALQPQIPMDWPCPRWLALHPAIAARLGWRSLPDRLFGWRAKNGAPVVESRWWCDGPAGSVESHWGDVTGTGWYVAVSPEGWKDLEAQVGNLSLHAWAGRFHAP